MQSHAPTVVSVDDLQSRLPHFVPTRFAELLSRWIIRVLGLNRINALYARCSICQGGAFASAVLDDLQIRLRVDLDPNAALALAYYRAESLPFTVVANHPLGALDGIALLAWLTPLFPDFRLLANHILQRVEALQSALFTVDPVHVGAAGSHNLAALHQAYHHVATGGVLGLFPTGRVATLWETFRNEQRPSCRPQVVKMLRHLQTPILPVHIGGRNTMFYYLTGLAGWRVRSLRLPSEVFAKRHSVLRLRVGAPLMPEEFFGGEK